jgi:hypothetical protein
VQRIAQLRHDVAERQAALSAPRNQLPDSPADPKVVADLLAARGRTSGRVSGRTANQSIKSIDANRGDRLAGVREQTKGGAL